MSLSSARHFSRSKRSSDRCNSWLRICRVVVEEGIEFIPDSQEEFVIGERTRPWNFFKLFVDHIESMEVLMGLLDLVGGRLRDLWCGNTGQDLVTVDLSAIATACPRLKSLFLSDVSVTMSDIDNEALCAWPLQKLEIEGSSMIWGLV